MLPFAITLRPGLPVHDQVVLAATRAVVAGQLRAGDDFPSVRVLSQALRINPNTAHRIIATLVDEGLLVVRTGVGTTVADWEPSGGAARQYLLEDEAERLVVAARRARMPLREVLAAIRRHWSDTSPLDK